METGLYLVNNVAQAPTLLLCGVFLGALPEPVYTPEAADFVAVSGAAYAVDASGAAVTITLPATPADCDKVAVRLDDMTNAVSVDPGAYTNAGVVGVSTLDGAMLGKTIIWKFDLVAGDWFPTAY